MNLAKVEISNVKGIPHLEFQAGSLTVVSGKNGCGKTSILDAISDVFAGGHHPELIRSGTDKAAVAMTLDNGVVIRKAITSKGTTLTITSSDGEPIKPEMEFVKSLATSFSFDPLAFIDAKPAERAKYLMAAMPLEFSADEIVATLPEQRAKLAREYFPVGAKLSLDELNLIGAKNGRIYSDRTKTNGAAENLNGTISTLTDGLMPEAESNVDWAAKTEELSGQLLGLKEELAMARAGLEAGTARQVAIVREREAAEIEKIRAAAREEIAKIEAEARRIEAEGTAEFQADIERLSGELANAKAKLSEVQRDRNNRAQVDRFRTDAAELWRKSDMLTGILEAVEAAKKRKLKECPIAGLEVRNGEVFYSANGGEPISFDLLNTATQYWLCFELAALSVGKLGLMVCDRAESLDDDQWAEFKQAAVSSGFQVIAARVEAGHQLRVQAEGDLFTAPAMAAKRGRK